MLIGTLHRPQNKQAQLKSTIISKRIIERIHTAHSRDYSPST